MNYPSRPSGNWGWRMDADDFDQNIQKRLAEFNVLYRRGKPPEKEKKHIVEETLEPVNPNA
jgi:4-alpha-glucanotransferase